MQFFVGIGIINHCCGKLVGVLGPLQHLKLRIFSDFGLSRCKYDNVSRSKSDISRALHHYNQLKPKLDKFTFSDGQTRDLIVLEGTIPVPYRYIMVL